MRKFWLVSSLVCLIAPAALAQDPLKVGAKYYKLEFENSQVRVLRVQVGAHEKVPMHEHPANVVISLTDGHSKFTLDRKSTRLNSSHIQKSRMPSSA